MSRRIGTGILTLISFAAVFAEPFWVLLISPIILGIPHVVSDVRFLFLRQLNSYDRRALYIVIAPITALFVLGLFAALGAPRYVHLEIILGIASILSAVLLSSIEEERKIFIGLTVLIAGWIFLLYPRIALLSLVHFHNLLAIGIWAALFQSADSARERRTILGIFFLSAVFLVGGTQFASSDSLFGSPPKDFGLTEVSSMLLPGVSLAIAAPVVRLYAFFQLIHYVVWLFLIPDSSTPSALKRDLGSFAFRTTIVVFLAVLCLGAMYPIKTREAYLTASSFHAWLELGLGAFLLLQRERVAQPNIS